MNYVQDIMISKSDKFSKIQIIVIIEFHDLIGTNYVRFNNDLLNDILL